MPKPIDTCLQCGETRATVAAEELSCGIMDGYEQPELMAEWPRHHWRDWSDAELRGMGIEPEFWDEHRRTSIHALESPIRRSICSREGHLPRDHRELFGGDCCVRCWIRVYDPTEREVA